ncbi:hypothetical protein KEM54_004478 [Ascosphaera aggregata]|nr:hypothetical protein KEM54_004478 [Ascosphaera aggregata]
MRVALTRLLRRPSTTGILRFLITAPVRIAQLNAVVTTSGCCARCYVHRSAGRDIFPTGSAFSEIAATNTTEESESDNGKVSRYSAASLLEDVLFESDIIESGRKSSNLLSNYLPPDPPMDTFGLDKRRLEHESNVTEPGLRLVDTEAFATDFDLWKELLNYQRRMHGAHGVIRIFNGMRTREVDVPTDGPHAEYFWRHLIDAGLWGPDEFLETLLRYAQDLHSRTGKKWQTMYEAIVGTLLENNLPGMATRWHDLLREVFLQNPNDIMAVFPQSLCTKNGLRTFRRLLDTVPGHKIHRHTVPVLWQQRRPMDAITMHRFLADRGDRPETLEEIEALLKYTQNYGFTTEKEVLLRSVAVLTNSPYEETLKYVAEHGVDALTRRVETEKTAAEAADHAEKGEKALSTHPGTQPIAKEKKFSDDLGARLFATNAFTFDLILSGFQMFAVSGIGPLSLREMALRANTAEKVHENIKALEKAGISLGTSIFSLTVKKLAAERSERLLRDLLHSDQHPDALEDQDLQERLLMSYTLEQDWTQVQRTMAILSVITEKVGIHDPQLYNVRLRQALKARDLSSCRIILAQMAADKVIPDRLSMKIAYYKILPSRRRTKQPPKDVEARTLNAFMLSLNQTVCLLGGEVTPTLWAEPLRRLGMVGPWGDLRAMMHWLARFYVPQRRQITPLDVPNNPLTGEREVEEDSKFFAKPILTAVKEPPVHYWMSATLPRDHKLSQYRQIFHPNMQRAIVAWGFLRRLSGRKPRTYPLPLHYSSRAPSSEEIAAQQYESKSQGKRVIPKEDYVILWCRGIVLLRELKDMGVVVQTSTVQRATRARLAILYGDENATKLRRPFNQTLREENPFTLDELIADINKCWPGLLADFESEKRAIVSPRPKMRERIRGKQQDWDEQDEQDSGAEEMESETESEGIDDTSKGDRRAELYEGQ